MDYAVVLYFDPQSERQIKRMMHYLTDEGVNDIYVNYGMRPHLTIAEFDTEDFSIVQSTIEQFSQEQPPFHIRFSSLGVFPGEHGVLFLAPNVDETLLAVHRRLNTVLEPLCHTFSPLYQDESWVPHCTLVLEMGPLEIAQAYAALYERFHALDTWAVSLAVVTCCPYLEVLETPLGRLVL
jgi:2'-5' RNA ligase